MTGELPIVRTVAALRSQVGAWRAAGETIALVPTMGALHAGHLSLVRRALDLSRRVIVTIFVNPIQFAPGEDFERYPRQEAADARALADAGADLLFAPEVKEMYPSGAATTVHVGGLTDVLCGPLRPGHFDGVATVVTKLLLQAAPDVALFGEKDFQQLQVIRRFVCDLDIPVRIEGVPIVRDATGLALSSRNAYLAQAELETARRLNVVLSEVAASVAGDPAGVETAERCGRAALKDAGFDAIDYLDVRDADTLERWTDPGRPARVFAAARVGKTRLIDNRAVPAVDRG